MLLYQCTIVIVANHSWIKRILSSICNFIAYIAAGKNYCSWKKLEKEESSTQSVNAYNFIDPNFYYNDKKIFNKLLIGYFKSKEILE